MGYCTKCGERLDDDAVFCMECGSKIQQKGKEITVKLSDVGKNAGLNYIEKKGKKSKKFIFIGIVVVLIVSAIVMYLNTGYICDGCGKQKYGTAYFDMWEHNIYYCKECAKEYYVGLDYENFAR